MVKKKAGNSAGSGWMAVLVAVVLMFVCGCGAKSKLQSTTGEQAVQEQQADQQNDTSQTTAQYRFSGKTADEILSELTLEQKIWQMIQPAVFSVDPGTMERCDFGSILSKYDGRFLSDEEWRDVIDDFQRAALSSDAGIPFIYGQDDVHGVNYCRGAVLFPHNIGLGAANDAELMYEIADTISDACMRLSLRNHGALIVMEYFDDLDKEITAGVNVDASVSVEMLLQIFYPNTPLHDGAVIIRNGRIYMASCVMPLSSRNVLEKSPERHMGLRHRAAMGVSEETDCLAIVVSEETGTISLCRHGEIERDLSPSRLAEIIRDTYEKPAPLSFTESVKQIINGWSLHGTKEKDGKNK